MSDETAERVELDWRGSDGGNDWESGWLWLGYWDLLARVHFELAPTGLVVFPITHFSDEDWTAFHLRYDPLCGIVSFAYFNVESGYGLDAWSLEDGPVTLDAATRDWVNQALVDDDGEGVSPDELLSRLMAVANLPQLRPLEASEAEDDGLDGDLWRPVDAGSPPAMG